MLTEPLRSPYDRRTIFAPKSKYKNRAVTARSSQGLRTAPVLCHYDVFTGYRYTIFKLLSKCRLLQNRRGYRDRRKP